jgi:tetratricopeptide (TPR) repeat protein
MRTRLLAVLFCLVSLPLASLVANAQSFGTAKEKVLLQRRLPALVHFSGSTFKVKASGHKEFGDLAPDVESLLETELMKNDSRLSTSESNPSMTINCEITDYTHPRPVVTTVPAVGTKKTAPKTTNNTRITGTLSVSFQARNASGQNLSSDTVTAKYDETFDGSGNNISHGIMNSMSGGWKRLTGGGSNEQLSPPTDAELRSKLITDVVRQIAAHLVNTNETVEVYLAKGKGPIDEGDKEATAGLWQRALETYETAPPSSKLDDDAYRLYNIGVAYEALAYKAEDEKSAMKFLDEAAINYGKAIDAKPGEKYFLEPQKRIETAIAHYKRIEDQENQRAEVAAAAEKAKKQAETEKEEAANKPANATPVAVPKAPDPKALTNKKVIAMIKAGVDDDTVAQTIRTAKLARFDLSAAGIKDLSTNGVSDQLVKAMKVREARKTVAAK